VSTQVMSTVDGSILFCFRCPLRKEWIEKKESFKQNPLIPSLKFYVVSQDWGER